MKRIRSAGALLAVAAVLAAGCSGEGDSSASAGGDLGDATNTTSDGSGAAGGDTQPGDACDGSVESLDVRFIVDDCGRVVILRGVNVESSSKGDRQEGDHLPKSGIDGQDALRNWGWNSVRFLVFWGPIEPEPGRYSEEYRDGVERWLDHYAEQGISVVLDMHQDLYGWAVGFDGAPDWAVDTQGLEPGELDPNQPWYLKGADPAVQAAYQSFWNPKDGQPDLQAAWLGALTHLAERFAEHPAVIGYDVMNEPAFANGDLAATLAIQPEAAAGRFRNENLTEFMQGGIEAVRAVDDDAWVFVEPTSLLNAFPYAGDLIAESLSDPRDGAPRLVYAGHLYEPEVHDGVGYRPESTYVEQWRSLRTAEATAMRAALWFGEWGGAPDQDRMDDYVAEVMAMADREMIGWSWWSWDPGGWSPIAEDLATISANGERLLWVQPRAVAGTPIGFGWDPAAGRFSLEWSERGDAIGPTEIAVPDALFPDGIDVVLDGEAVAEPDWDRSRSVLSIDADRSRATHTLCIAAANANRC